MIELIVMTIDSKNDCNTIITNFNGTLDDAKSHYKSIYTNCIVLLNESNMNKVIHNLIMCGLNVKCYPSKNFLNNKYKVYNNNVELNLNTCSMFSLASIVFNDYIIKQTLDSLSKIQMEFVIIALEKELILKNLIKKKEFLEFYKI